MRCVSITLALLGLTAAIPAIAQPGVIHWDAKPRAFSSADFDALVACTLEKHPESTKRFATYVVQRRDKQTWQENERDPDSQLFFPSLEGCISLADGERFPFAPDSLVYRWAAAHKIPKQVP